MSKETQELRNRIIELESRIQEMEGSLTKCEKMEIALKKSEERFIAFAESATDGIITSDVDGNILFFNKSVKTMFGFSAKELEGKPLTVLMPDRFKEGYLDKLKQYRSGGEHGLIGKTFETTGMKKDSTEFPFEMSLSTWKSGDELYFSAIIRDITERKKAEEERKKTEEKYRYIVEKVLKVSNEILQVMNKP
jgi:PAS domain S-box-containing protein